MDLNEDIIKDEVSSFVSNLQKFLPKKKDYPNIITINAPAKVKMTRLTDIHKEAKSVFPHCFIGARLFILRQIVDKLKLVQQYSYGRPKDSYKSFNHLIHKEMDCVRTDDGLLVDASGSASATYSEKLDGPYEVRLTSNIKDLVASDNEITLERENEQSVSSVTFSMKDVEASSVKVVTQWMYRILPDLYVGTELSLKPMTYPPSPAMSMSVRYERPSYTLSSTISKNGLQACFYKQFSQNLSLATIVNEGILGGPASFGVALHKSLQNATELKLFVDSMRCGGFTVQRDVHFTDTNQARMLRLTASTLIDKQRRVRFGFGFNLEL